MEVDQVPSKAHPEGVRLLPDDPFFAEGNMTVRETRIMKDQDTDPEACYSFSIVQCSTCQTTFHNVPAFQAHYNARHRSICADCKKAFPNSHLLDLHIRERHDLTLSPDTPRFRCIVQCCKESFTSWSVRKEHMIKLHLYPADFKYTPSERPKELPKQKTSVPKHICFGRGSVAAWHRRAAPTQDITMKDLEVAIGLVKND
ncbi:zinc finger protein 511-like [Ornithodoros turicata]